MADYAKRLWRWFSRKEPDTSIREAIEELIEEDIEGESSIGTDERLLLSNVLSLKDLIAKDVMIPYANIIAIPITASAEEASSIFVKSGVSHLPVFSNTIDNIVGIMSVSDAMAFISNKTHAGIKSFLKDVTFIAPTMRTLDLLLQMRETGTRLVVVVDEYGGVEGIVTFSSLIEEIIGDIQYAEDYGEKNRVEIQPNGCIVINASTTLEELDESLEKICEERVDWLSGFEEEDVETVGGMVALLAGRVPLRGELIAHPKGVEFEILDADPRKIKKIAVWNLINVKQ
jgi:CBS domain containing-hemolysin-like protein